MSYLRFLSKGISNRFLIEDKLLFGPPDASYFIFQSLKARCALTIDQKLFSEYYGRAFKDFDFKSNDPNLDKRTSILNSILGQGSGTYEVIRESFVNYMEERCHVLGSTMLQSNAEFNILNTGYWKEFGIVDVNQVKGFNKGGVMGRLLDEVEFSLVISGTGKKDRGKIKQLTNDKQGLVNWLVFNSVVLNVNTSKLAADRPNVRCVFVRTLEKESPDDLGNIPELKQAFHEATTKTVTNKLNNLTNVRVNDLGELNKLIMYIENGQL